MKKPDDRQPPPTELSAEAQNWWRLFVTEWQLDDASLLILRSGLEALDRMRQAQDLIAKHGLVAPDRFGQLKQNPATIIERDSRAAMLSAFKRLNLDLEPLAAGPGRPSR